MNASITASATDLTRGGSSTVTARWSPADTDVSLGIRADSTSVLHRSTNCPRDGREQRSSEEGILNEGVATLTVYGCDEGTGVVQLTRGSTVLASISITVSGTPPPVEPDPTGSLTASPGTIERRGSSLVTARWSPASQEVRLVVGTAILRTTPCASTGGRGASATEATRQLTVYGCASGYGLVRLETIPPVGGTAETLTTITIRVATDPPADPADTPTPTPTPSGADPEPPGADPRPTPELPSSGSPSQRAYRWLYITWTAPGDYVRFEIEASVGSGNWAKVPEVRNGRPKAGNERAIIDHRARTAHVRGLTHSSGALTQFRVTGITSNDLKRTSAMFTLIQDSAPSSSGHQHDHTVAYGLGLLGVETLDSWLRLETAGEASKWECAPLRQHVRGVRVHDQFGRTCTPRGERFGMQRHRSCLRGRILQHRGPYWRHHHILRAESNGENDNMAVDKGEGVAWNLYRCNEDQEIPLPQPR